MMLPLDATGFAPRISQYDVWSTSGIGNMKRCPYIAWQATCCGSWSTDVAENRLRVRSARMSAGPFRMLPTWCAFGIAEIDAQRVGAVPALDVGEPARDEIERFLPSDRRPLASRAAHRRA